MCVYIYFMYIFTYIFPIFPIFYVYFILVQKMIVVYPNSYLSPMMFLFPLSLLCVNPFASQPFWSSFLDTLLQFSFQLLCREKEKKNTCHQDVEDVQPFSCQVGTCFSDELSSCHTRAPACHISQKSTGLDQAHIREGVCWKPCDLLLKPASGAS